MADTLTIAAAARHCGVHRRTLQRAIKAGKLLLTPRAWSHAGRPRTGRVYPCGAPQRPPHRDTPQDLTLLLVSLIARIDRLISLLEVQHGTPIPQRHTAGAPQHLTAATPQRHAPATHRSNTAAGVEAIAPYDPTRFLLGRLCLRGHDYQGTGQSLRRRHNGECAQCNIDQQRERRQRQREQREGGQ